MTPTPAIQTGANVRAEMARRRVTQARLAAHLGLSQPTVNARLSGKIPFDINELHAVADYLDVSLSVLLPVQGDAA